NEASTAVGTILIDQRPPSVEVNREILPQYAISDTLILSGTVSELPDWGSSVVQLHFEEAAAATTFYDDSNEENDATCTNCPGTAVGIFGQAAAFDGADDHLTITDTQSLDFDGNFSISLWLQPNNWSNSQQTPFVSKGDGSGNNVANYIFSKWDSGDQALAFSYYNNGWIDIIDDSGTSYANAVWTHLAMVVDSDNDEVRFYKDGVLLSVQT
ncbi:MAG: LamG domain-containing protein, partial [bacterium]|nr:LamG domain-containing protein [bacterium]